ncbi:hypothetical protein SAMD00019534_055220 [Acytostelium subglobosum LB1]|uniref:hypothetical protein n=1 Tax=Acytostelium subglobosum LB1 TaxID=1410327 RepID=UPI0006451207|nr:hypothetical protein SAMD00019534_055220 [Acytostelium subglobosum LB1]GAM22347.1 hypothetical protein SAMD00019534_055220 [Acytostelium subglobosum LB1]|eukprot:XP_012754467.1 hypothetical protein SAMD00019534_055220 [Acytostelium subglobosum LB1]
MEVLDQAQQSFNNKDFINSTAKYEDKKSKVKFVAQEKKKEEDIVLPLENGWCFWEDHYVNHGERATQEEYMASLRQISAFQSVQDFWSEFNKLPNLSKVPNNSCYHLMKKDVRPVWEDPENQNGGVLILKVKKFLTDEIWNELVLSVIGEQFSSYLNADDDICGVSIRKKQGIDYNIIHIWNKTSSGHLCLNRALKILVPLISDGCIYQYYREHKQDMKNGNNNHINTLRKSHEELELERHIEHLKEEIRKEEIELTETIKKEAEFLSITLKKEHEDSQDFEKMDAKPSSPFTDPAIEDIYE